MGTQKLEGWEPEMNHPRCKCGLTMTYKHDLESGARRYQCPDCGRNAYLKTEVNGEDHLIFSPLVAILLVRPSDLVNHSDNPVWRN
jgi:transposase-like protein